MVHQCSELFYCKVSSEFLQQDSQSSYSFGKTQNVGVPELSQEKKISVSLQKDFIFCFHTHTHTHTHAYTHTHTHRERDRHTHTQTHTHTHTHTHNIFGFAEDISWRRQKGTKCAK